MGDRCPRTGSRAAWVNGRIERHRRIAAEIAGLRDEELLARLESCRDGGQPVITLPASGDEVFVKLLPLTDVECAPGNRRSTANLFGLPSHYHYRLGSYGFGVWRELDVHRMTNEWVLSGRCPDFALLHGWRTLPLVDQVKDDRSDAALWGNDSAIERRIASVADATASAVLFVERLPMTLTQWIASRTRDELAAVIRPTEAALLELLAFVNARGVLHMDAHLENVLTDGDQLFLCDHGLAMAPTFDLDAEELDFLERHQNFDRSTVVTGLVHAVVTHADPPDRLRGDWRDALREPLPEDMPPGLRSYVAERAAVALEMGDFYRRLRADLATEYPAARLQLLLDAV